MVFIDHYLQCKRREEIDDACDYYVLELILIWIVLALMFNIGMAFCCSKKEIEIVQSTQNTNLGDGVHVGIPVPGTYPMNGLSV